MRLARAATAILAAVLAVYVISNTLAPFRIDSDGKKLLFSVGNSSLINVLFGSISLRELFDMINASASFAESLRRQIETNEVWFRFSKVALTCLRDHQRSQIQQQ